LDLPPDPKLPSDRLRFLPQRFNLAGAALDPHNIPCEKMACPECHLPIPRPWLYLNNFFVSIAGAPASGKSYFLASMIWQLRKTMAKSFQSNFTDADPQMNRRIFDYETTLFTGSDDPRKLVRIDKTDIAGNIYNNTIINGTPTQLAQPFIYTLEPMPNHPLMARANKTRQVICVYDNAGEHFLPGADRISVPVTRHMAKSDALLFIFDPTQDVRFRAACTEPVDDPQMNPALSGSKNETQNRIHSTRQEVVLGNVLAQIRNLNFLPPHEKIKMPLIIVLSKYDAWKQLTRGKFSAGKAPEELSPWKSTAGGSVNYDYYRSKRVEQYSQKLRTMLLDLIPQLVSTAESTAENVTYIAVSATGGPPELGAPDEQGIRPLCYRPINVKPIWAEVPFLHAQYLANKSAVPFAKDGQAIM
ncbi:MAG: hypothetical protein LBI05_11110, partial [Planctomycetaceae bacterium]|nr:hypothetical protein [Planctomycetaceae bacterium]